MSPDVSQRAESILERVATWGITPEIQRRLGAFGVVWGMFETNLERAVLSLQGETIGPGVRPSTDGTPIAEWIKILAQPSTRIPRSEHGLLEYASEAATDLMEYRHAVVHGWLMPSSLGLSFIRNPRWKGELRKRPSNEAYVSERLLDMAIDASWVLCQLVFTLRIACEQPARADLRSLVPDVARARSQALELRHLADLMNHEKS